MQKSYFYFLVAAERVYDADPRGPGQSAVLPLHLHGASPELRGYPPAGHCRAHLQGLPSEPFREI